MNNRLTASMSNLVDGNHQAISNCTLCTDIVGAEVHGIINDCAVFGGHTFDVYFRANQ